MEHFIREIEGVYLRRHWGWFAVQEFPDFLRAIFWTLFGLMPFAFVHGGDWWWTVATSYAAFLAANLTAACLGSYLLNSTPPEHVACKYSALVKAKVQEYRQRVAEGSDCSPIHPSQIYLLEDELPEARRWRQLIGARVQVEAALWLLDSNSIPEEELFKLARRVVQVTPNEPPYSRLRRSASKIVSGWNPFLG